MSITTYGMEYAVSIGAVLLFLLLHILTKKKPREAYCEKLSAEKFEAEAAGFTRGMNLPEKGGGIINVSKFKTIIFISAMRLIARQMRSKLRSKKNIADGIGKSSGGKINLYREFYGLYNGNKKMTRALIKTDYAVLQSLPTSDGEARVVKLARFALAHSEYIFTADRIKYLLDTQNEFKTLTYAEVCGLETAFKYVLYEKLSFEHEHINTLLKLDKKIKKCEKEILRRGTNAYEPIKKYGIFINAVEERERFNGEECVYENSGNGDIAEVYAQQEKAAENIAFFYNNVIYSANALNSYDFKSYYKPSELLKAYPYFKNAGNIERDNFLALLGKLSDKENIDEEMYALRLVNFAVDAGFKRAEGYRIKPGSATLSVIRYKNNILTLARALVYDGIMADSFGQNKSIFKLIKYKISKSTK